MSLRVKINTEALDRLARAMADLRGRGADGVFRPVYLAAAKAMEAAAVGDFERAARTTWPPLSPVTAILRRRAGRKLASMDEARMVAGKLRPLQDTGILRASLRAGAQGHAAVLSRHRVTVGTNVRYAKLHQHGGLVTFRFGAEEEARFDKNFRQTLPGKAPAAKGRRRRAKRNWNREYFILRATFRKWGREGRSFRVPQRQVVSTAPADVTRLAEKLHRVFATGIELTMRREVRGG